MIRVDEHIVLKRPKSVMNGSPTLYGAWTRRAILRAVWALRNRIMDESGVDIFQVYEMTDCVEVHIEGEFETLPVPPGWVRKENRRKLYKAR